ncbi:MAG: hypothetical protein ACYDAG_18675, partial [Chloroflexota bacterium]
MVHTPPVYVGSPAGSGVIGVRCWRIAPTMVLSLSLLSACGQTVSTVSTPGGNSGASAVAAPAAGGIPRPLGTPIAEGASEAALASTATAIAGATATVRAAKASATAQAYATATATAAQAVLERRYAQLQADVKAGRYLEAIANGETMLALQKDYKDVAKLVSAAKSKGRLALAASDGLYSIALDGTDLKREIAAPMSGAIVSASGKVAAYGDSGLNKLFVANFNQRKTVPLPSLKGFSMGNLVGPTGDGRMFATGEDQNYKSGVATITTATGASSFARCDKISSNGALAMAPDGSKVLVRGNSNVHYWIFLSAKASCVPTPIDLTESPSSFAFSPDGNTIYFSAGGNLYRMALSGANQTKLYTNVGLDRFGLSPDGEYAVGLVNGRITAFRLKGALGTIPIATVQGGLSIAGWMSRAAPAPMITTRSPLPVS